jgi:hypothetical protein
LYWCEYRIGCTGSEEVTGEPDPSRPDTALRHEPSTPCAANTILADLGTLVARWEDDAGRYSNNTKDECARALRAVLRMPRAPERHPVTVR